MNTTRTGQARPREAAQLAAALTQAQTAIKQARTVWGRWADTVRQEAETRHGVGYTEADPTILADREYGDALDLGSGLDQALIDLTALIDHLWRCQPSCATADDVPAACPIGRSTAGTYGHSRTARYILSPANRQADPLRKPTF